MKRYFVILTILFLFSYVPTTYSYGWGFKPSINEQGPDIGKYEEIIKKNLAFYAESTDEKNIYITFDNGYEQGFTKSILSILKKHDVPATFFVTGHYVNSEPELVKQMVREGHLIGNHSFNHPDFTTMDKPSIKTELKTLEEAVANITDQKEMNYVRPPRGTFNEKTLQWIESLGYIHVFWSVAFKDWEVDRQRGWQYAYDHMMKQIHPGAIVLLHTVSEDNALALEKAIVRLKKRGYKFKSLDELMIRQLTDGILF